MYNLVEDYTEYTTPLSPLGNCDQILYAVEKPGVTHLPSLTATGCP